jgi:hypothetical protein
MKKTASKNVDFCLFLFPCSLSHFEYELKFTELYLLLQRFVYHSEESGHNLYMIVIAIYFFPFQGTVSSDIGLYVF